MIRSEGTKTGHSLWPQGSFSMATKRSLWTQTKICDHREISLWSNRDIAVAEEKSLSVATEKSLCGYRDAWSFEKLALGDSSKFWRFHFLSRHEVLLLNATSVHTNVTRDEKCQADLLIEGRYFLIRSHSIGYFQRPVPLKIITEWRSHRLRVSCFTM